MAELLECNLHLLYFHVLVSSEKDGYLVGDVLAVLFEVITF